MYTDTGVHLKKELPPIHSSSDASNAFTDCTSAWPKLEVLEAGGSMEELSMYLVLSVKPGPDDQQIMNLYYALTLTCLFRHDLRHPTVSDKVEGNNSLDQIPAQRSFLDWGA